ncbi:MAG: flavodoxin [Planctomycetia bacterium]|nr:flavodoxin [Planctomycetia bacterium]
MKKSILWSEKNILVACYSYSGNTRLVAEQIQKITGGNLWFIQPQNPYPPQYNACVEQARKEIQAGFRPELVASLKNLADYDMIFVGSPNWWSTIAPPVATFLSQGDFSGKIVIPFITHGGGGMARCVEAIRELSPSAQVLASKAFRGENVRRESETIRSWLTEIQRSISST